MGWPGERKRTFALRYHLVLLVALATVPVLFFTGRIVGDLGREQRLSVEAGLQTTARALAIAVEREIAASTRALEVLATSEVLARDDLPAFHRQVLRTVAANDQWYLVALADAAGQIVLSSNSAYGTPLPSIGDRRYIRDVMREGRPTVSDVIVGRTTGRLNISVAVPVRRDGRVRYALFAGVNPDALGRIVVAESIPATWLVAVTDTAHAIVARNRDADRFIGRGLMEPVKSAVSRAPEGTARLPVADGPEVYAAWQRTASLGWTVILGAPVAVVDASLRRSMWTVAIVGLAVTLAGVAVALALGRRISGTIGALRTAADALGRGAVPVSPPSSIAEVNAVGRALEVAGVTIKARTEELVASQSMVKRLVDSSLIGILVGEDDRIVDANDACLRMLGYRREDLAEGTLRWPHDVAVLDRARASGEATPYETEYVRKDGTRLPVLLGGAFVDDSRRHWVAFVLDVTERKRVEREHALRVEAEAASRTKDEFLAIVSHELRTPLAAVLASIHTLRSGRLGPTEAREAMARIDRNARLQARLIDDLLDLSRVVAGKLEVKRTAVQLGEIVHEAVSALRDEAERRHVKLDETIAAAEPVVHGDPQRLHQIALNLLGNALKFTPAGGVVHVTVEARESRVAFVVRDTGVGIDRELLPHLFEPFRQGVGARGRGGLGLGLAIVHRLVEMQGGTVRAESGGPGTGATFTVELPAATA